MRSQVLLDELKWRDLLFQSTEKIGDALDRGQVTGYAGFDPTADSLHVGSLIPVLGLVHLQRSGHRPIALVGGGTGLIGDPSGKQKERTLQTRDMVAANTAAIRAQLERWLDFTPGPTGALLEDNATWLCEARLVEFLRDIGKHFSVNEMVKPDSVRTRLEERDQ